jgi:hypothetical protein
MRDVKLGSMEAQHAALEMLRAHERYHFRFELGALHNELVLEKPFYNGYTQQVYRNAIFTPQCFEESLANRAVTLLRFAGRQLPHGDLKKFVIEFCSNSPPGYCDFNRDAAMMKECLLGQLRTRALSSRIGGSEGDWLATWTQHQCPEYLIRGASFAAGKFITCKRGGRVWRIHPEDPDPWPSKPHAHEYELRQKLSLSTGEIFYVPSRTRVDKLHRKELEDLRNDLARRRPTLALPPVIA